jgi:DNA-3-methyladenine glycosylase II
MTPPLPFNSKSAARALAKADPVLGQVIARVGPCTVAPRSHASPFHALVRSIVFQQLNGKAAGTIHGRVIAHFGDDQRLTPDALLQAPERALRAAGLSANKLLALRDLAAKALDGTVPTLEQAEQLSDDELIARLTAVRGIGEWTVHMLLIFYLGRLDVMPTGDFAIRKAFRQLYRKRREPSVETILRHAKLWQPYRSIASWYLWRSLDVITPQQ